MKEQSPPKNVTRVFIHYETKTHEILVKILMEKSQGFHVILTGFSWFNSWDFSHGNPMKKALKTP